MSSINNIKKEGHMNKDTVYFYLPSFYSWYSLNYGLIQLLDTKPEYFYNIKIGAIYGHFPGQIWNGGRFLQATKPDIDNILLTVKNFNDLGVPVRFTYTNCLIKEEHLDDIYCNFVAKNCENGMNEILCNSEILENYLRKKYPNYKFILSTTKGINGIDKLNELSDKYMLMVPDYKLNNDWDSLVRIKDKGKIETLLNSYCAPDCPLRALHYEHIAKSNLNPDEFFANEWLCPHPQPDFWEVLESPLSVKNEDLYGKYYDMGFRHFKIEGRSEHLADVVDSYVYYMVKPEWRDKVRNMLIKFQLGLPQFKRPQ